MRKTILFVLAFCFLSGCNKTLYIPDGKAVKLRETVKGVKIWVLDSRNKLQPRIMDLPEGWYALPDPGE